MLEPTQGAAGTPPALSCARMSETTAFEWRMRGSGELAILRAGRVVTLVRGEAAARLAERLTASNAATVQRLLARATGNYRRGNERLAGDHQRNRGR